MEIKMRNWKLVCPGKEELQLKKKFSNNCDFFQNNKSNEKITTKPRLISGRQYFQWS